MNESVPCHILEWDSEFFQRRIARISKGLLSQPEMERVLDWSRQHAVDGLYYLVEASNSESIRLAEDNHFRFVDSRVSLEYSITKAPGAVDPDIVLGGEDDKPTLLNLAREAHHDSRFYSDPHFPRERCDELYATWLSKSFEGYADAVLVAHGQGCACGYITCKIQDGQWGQIGLVGVDENTRGQGWGQRLVSAALRWFALQSCLCVRVVTQGRNIPAQRMYQKCGFRTRQVQYWYHFWF